MRADASRHNAELSFLGIFIVLSPFSANHYYVYDHDSPCLTAYVSYSK